MNCKICGEPYVQCGGSFRGVVAFGCLAHPVQHVYSDQMRPSEAEALLAESERRNSASREEYAKREGHSSWDSMSKSRSK